MNSSNLTHIKKMYSKFDDLLLAANSNCNYLNLGYWKQTNNVIKASEDLLDLVIEKAEIKDGNKILDVGFGYGEQDIYFANKFPKIEINGINILTKQVEFAQQKVKLAGLSNRVVLIDGDAVNLTFEDSIFDLTLAIESAFHFDTRQMFFNESYRVLKPGGIIVLTDCLPQTFSKNDKKFIEASTNMGIPLANQYNIQVYIDKLKEVGFEKISYIDLTKHVIPYSAIEMIQNNGWRSKTEINLEDEIYLEEKFKYFTEKTTIAHYYLVKAYKKKINE
jgi:microcystin synthetase protein McyJ